MRPAKRFWSRASVSPRKPAFCERRPSERRWNFGRPLKKSLGALGVVLPTAFTSGASSGASHCLAKRRIGKQPAYQLCQFLRIAGILQEKSILGVTDIFTGTGANARNYR